MTSFWQTLPKPFFVLAPMEDVTDSVFRRIVASCARPDVFYTEFTNSDGMLSVGKNIVNQRLQYTERERPLVAQIWGIHPESFYQSTKLIASMGLDGIDINFGCPKQAVVSHGACSAMIDHHNAVKAILDAVKKAIAESGKPLALSVKTRIGYKTIANDWIPFLLMQQLDELTIHGRTAAEMSKAPVHWDEIGKAVEIRNTLGVATRIVGNGDIKSVAEGKEKCSQYDLDGIMIGRAVFDNPWIFDRSDNPHVPNHRELLELMRRHILLFHETWGTSKHFAIVKKFFKMYTRGLEGGGELREKLMQEEDWEETIRIVDNTLVQMTSTL